MSSILFVDYACLKPYDLNTLKTEPMGGSEATLVRIAEGLLAKGHQVTVIQHNRIESSSIYKTIDEYPASADVVICMRSPKMTPLLIKSYPNAKHFMWSQDLPFDNLVNDLYLIRNQNFKLIAVSAWHSNQFDHKTGGHYSPQFVHNPIEDTLRGDGRAVDMNKFVFFSSPHKGFNETIRIFEEVHNKWPDAKLYYSNPGYYPDAQASKPYLINMGQMSNTKVLEFIKDAFCVFYPNISYPETFGIIYAEANALGIPVLCHDLGAASEVLSDPEKQMVDCNKTEEIIARIELWRSERPSICAREDFRLSNILVKWEEVLGLETIKYEETEYIESTLFE
jgi:glycosyltransferase involved in cell wall biosynthesis